MGVGDDDALHLGDRGPDRAQPGRQGRRVGGRRIARDLRGDHRAYRLLVGGLVELLEHGVHERAERRAACDAALALLARDRGELGSIVAGKSERAPKAGDRRFSDSAWRDSSWYSGLLKAYLAWGEAVNVLVDKTSLGDIDKARVHLVTDIMVDALAPTNALPTNPTAVRKFVDTGGRSLWQGLKNYLDDLAQNGGMPSMVDGTGRRRYSL